MKRISIALLIIFALFVSSVLAVQIIQITLNGTNLLYPESLVATSLKNYNIATVIRVVDGDTAYLKGMILWRYQNISTRFIGIDTPETVNPRKPVQYFGKQASAFTKEILTSRMVYVTYDQNTLDKYGRLLAYIWLKSNDKYYMFNAILVANGYARYYKYFPFKKEYMLVFHDCEAYAKTHGIGMWGKLTIANIHANGKDEYVEIKNESNHTINLSGWKLESDPKQFYAFPDITLQPGQSVKIHSGPNASGEYIWTKKYIWRNKGDICWMHEPSGKEVCVYEYPKVKK